MSPEAPADYSNMVASSDYGGAVQPTLNDRLWGYYRCDDTDASPILADATGQGHDFTFSGAGIIPTRVAGQVGPFAKRFVVSGVGLTQRAASPATLFNIFRDPWAIAAWVYLTNPASVPHVILSYPYVTSIAVDSGIIFGFDWNSGTGALTWQCSAGRDSGGAQFYHQKPLTGVPNPINTKYLFVASYRGASRPTYPVTDSLFTLWVNNVVRSIPALTDGAIYPAATFPTKYQSLQWRLGDFSGDLGPVGIWTRALEQTDVDALWQNGAGIVLPY